MDKIDCFGDICPIPLLKLQNSLKTLKSGHSIMLVVDHSCVVESISDYYNSSKHQVSIDEIINGVWEITVTKSV
ncbi:MAG: sulfurtransferase TusA family protein [Clostridiales bacterium]|nr:sulfurtransferase TusA family protein [Clostridiales bacterium]